MKLKIKSAFFRDKYIYTDLLENSNSKALIIFMSGFSGSMNLPLFKKAESYFYEAGYSTLRINFCHESEDGKKLPDSLDQEQMSLSVYASELKGVINNLISYKNIVLIGHSFGAVISLYFLSKFEKYSKKIKLAMWDQSLLPWSIKDMEKIFTYDDQEKLYKTKDNDLSINSDFYNDFLKTDSIDIFKNISVDYCLIAAKGSGDKDAKKYFEARKLGTELHIIPGTGHMFGNKKAQRELFDRTLAFIEEPPFTQ